MSFHDGFHASLDAATAMNFRAVFLLDAFAFCRDGRRSVIWAILRGLGRYGPRSIALGSSLPWLR
jgi:hypothetical protein